MPVLCQILYAAPHMTGFKVFGVKVRYSTSVRFTPLDRLQSHHYKRNVKSKLNSSAWSNIPLNHRDLSGGTLLCIKILTFCFCSQLQQAQRYAKLLAPSKKVSYQTLIVDLFLPMSQVGNSKWIPTCQPSKNPSGTTPTSFCATLFFQWFFV
jgi:hypothetical protein